MLVVKHNRVFFSDGRRVIRPEDIDNMNGEEFMQFLTHMKFKMGGYGKK